MTANIKLTIVGAAVFVPFLSVAILWPRIIDVLLSTAASLGLVVIASWFVGNVLVLIYGAARGRLPWGLTKKDGLL